jgi:hypothetical protein
MYHCTTLNLQTDTVRVIIVVTVIRMTSSYSTNVWRGVDLGPLIPWNKVLLKKLIDTQSRNFPRFMEPEGLLSFSKFSSSGPYPEPY